MSEEDIVNLIEEKIYVEIMNSVGQDTKCEILVHDGFQNTLIEG
jgi:hypothetical protein